MDSFSSNLVLPNLTSSQVIDTLSEWDGMDSTVALFQDLVISESGECVKIGCDIEQVVNNNCVIHCYILPSL